MRGVAAVVLACLVGGCASLEFEYTPTTVQRAPAKPTGCDFEVLTVRPDRHFVELGVLESRSLPTASVATFRTAVAPKVCAAGGDAVLAMMDGKGWLVRGTVIKYEDGAASPPAASAP
jgi:hypothetical protein